MESNGSSENLARKHASTVCGFLALLVWAPLWEDWKIWVHNHCLYICLCQTNLHHDIKSLANHNSTQKWARQESWYAGKYSGLPIILLLHIVKEFCNHLLYYFLLLLPWHPFLPLLGEQGRCLSKWDHPLCQRNTLPGRYFLCSSNISDISACGLPHHVLPGDQALLAAAHSWKAKQ